MGSVQNSWDIGCKNPPNLKHKSTHPFFSPSPKCWKQLGHNWHKKLGFCPDWIFKGKWNLIIFLVPCSPDRYIFPLLYHIIAHIIIIPRTRNLSLRTHYSYYYDVKHIIYETSLFLLILNAPLSSLHLKQYLQRARDTGTPPRAGAQVLFLLYSSSLFPQLPQFSNL